MKSRIEQLPESLGKNKLMQNFMMVFSAVGENEGE